MTNRFVPHETTAQATIHTCWPAAQDLWEADLAPARGEFARFLTQVGDATGGHLTIYAATAEAESDARHHFRSAKIVRESYGDVWARDTGPVFVNDNGQLKAVRMNFNGWGGKYELAGDQTIGARIAAEAGAEVINADFICEGGALEFDGEGTLITTRQCVLNPNRNPGMSEADFEDRALSLFGVRKVIWLDEGLVGDHTDGHVDNIARFAGPGHVVCQEACGPDDPNARILRAIETALSSATDAKGRRLTVSTIPSPGRVLDEDGEPMAASHMNWIVGAGKLVMPVYSQNGEAARRALEKVFKAHRVFASMSSAILTGGGSFHCVTCQQPVV